MYLSFYDLKEKPFSISTDPKFLWLGEKHKEAFAVLKYGVLDNKGFLLLTGDVGAGKTTLINALVTSLGDDVIFASVPDPGLELMEFYKYLAHAFKLDDSFSNKTDFLFVLRSFLHNAYDNGKKILLIIDEAQRLSSELLEEIRLLSNIELQDMKLLNIFFVGQVEFNTKLLQPENRAVRQRITISNHIQPLTEKETGEYIRHRLKVAGSKKNIFSYVAIHEVHKFSGGYPRLINIVCDIALLTGYVREVKKIGDDIIGESVESLNIEPHTVSEADKLQEETPVEGAFPGPFKKETLASDKPKNTGWHKAAVLYVCMLLTIVVIYYLYSEGYVFQQKDVSGKSEIQSHVNSAEISPPSDNDSDKMGENQNIVDANLIPNELNHDLEHGKATGEFEPAEIIKTIPGVGFSKNKNVIPFKNNKLTIDFTHNSNEFSEEVYANLEKLSDFMKINPEVFVLVIGYTDDMGAYSYNVSLSSFRSNIVKSYLAGKGIDRSRIRATGLGPENPRASNETSAGRKANRRVEIEIMNYYR